MHAKNKGVSPRTYGPFLKILGTLPAPPKPIDAPATIPNPGILTLAGFDRAAHPVDQYREVDNNKEYRAPPATETDRSYESFNGPLGDFAVPTMEELGMVGTTSIRGGETRALEVFEEFMKDKSRVANFEKPKTAPGLFDPPSSASPHISTESDN